MFKRIITLLLALFMLMPLVSCSKTPEPMPSASYTSEMIVSDTTKPKKASHYTFQPKVCSPLFEEVMGTKMKDAYFSFVDAVMDGRDTFDCPDQDTYDWMIGQFPYRCFPVLAEVIEPTYNGDNDVVDGKAGYRWKVSEEDGRRKIDEFISLTESILNEALEDDYTDLEKALALYVYFEEHYEYDYDTYEKMDEQSPDYISGYRLMTTGTGICQEISTAYSFLLMQAGVDATVMSGTRSYDQESHQWSYVRINGKTYHIDPTYVLLSDHYLGYFMMTDKQREECDSYTPDTFVIATNYSQDHSHPEYIADDDHFKPIWDTYLVSFDHESHKMTCRYYDDNFDEHQTEFDYSRF